MDTKRETLLPLATYASVATAILLVGLKTWAWLASGSVSLLASLVDSLTDSLASIVNLFAVRLALRPADDNHPFGHGKAESLSALAQSAFIGGSAVFLLLNAVERLLHPQPLQQTTLGIAVMLVSLLLTLALVLFQRWVLRRAQSQAVSADSLHYVTDFASNIVVLVALVLAAWGWQRADAVLALLLGGWIFWSAAKIAIEAVNTLMDKALPPADVARIEAAALAVPGVLGIHDLRTRLSGARHFVQMHIDLDARLNIVEAHDIAVAVAAQIRALFEEAEVIVHQDPVEAGGQSAGQEAV
ncbi:MAG: cation diffusion facilitator family transporter [Neisseria sp.]|mgnify:FL=1|jgi:ferrous-iron efflux pump FieF|uniref:cation diffusion facilitator family transporter n=1 Tax=Uruburuella suis TaxID=252130 RepID=UPI001B49C626|nr:cation diffusion facilitator family transporter [Neisseria sp.]MBP7258987.1 cation diffusion facilitator family transporter [Neisseria sp.]MBP7968853.1 cation diffusion facilitator family transporter [Neisseria sp.]MBP8043584.1 cation diffusion facilitator family transporter [Neisseria sp.]MBP8045971.1 cation diffusion facilitator family transporter [Neisseria sp.]